MIAIFALVHRDGRNVRDDHPGTTGVAVVVDDVSDEDEMIMEAKALLVSRWSKVQVMQVSGLTECA